jgi:hypothetical protein
MSEKVFVAIAAAATCYKSGNHHKRNECNISWWTYKFVSWPDY